MRATPSTLGNDLVGYGRLAVDATLGLTRLVETLHHNILRAPAPLGEATQQPAPGLTGFVYRTVRGVTRLTGSVVDRLLQPLATLLPDEASAPRDNVRSILNGVLGDHLAATGNPLAIEMQLRQHGTALVMTRKGLAGIAHPSERILVLVHGLCMNDHLWRRRGHDHGAALAAEAGYSAVYAHYNTGLHISSNGRELAGALQRLVQHWPVPVKELAIVAHSMGGLVTRSACHYGGEARHEWCSRLSALAFLGSPHHGAPLEQGGHWLDRILGASPYTIAFRQLGRLRSAGITDLRHGSLLESDWENIDRFAAGTGQPHRVPLPTGPRCYAIAGSLGAASQRRSRRFGDGLVPVQGALGKHPNPLRNLDFPAEHQVVFDAVSHLDLLHHPAVYAQLAAWLSTGMK